METITTYGVGPDQPTYAQLREQNRVLASHLNNLVEWALEVTKDWTVDDDSTLANDLRMIWQAQAAITATSQPKEVSE